MIKSKNIHLLLLVVFFTGVDFFSVAQSVQFDYSKLKKIGNITYYSNENLTPEQIDALLAEAQKKQKTPPQFVNYIAVVEKNPTETNVPEIDNDALYQANLLVGEDGRVRAIKAAGKVPFTLNIFIKIYCLSQFFKPAQNKKGEPMPGFVSVKKIVKLNMTGKADESNNWGLIFIDP